MTIRVVSRIGVVLGLAVLMTKVAPTVVAQAEQDPTPPMSVEVHPFFFAISVQNAESSAAWYQRVFGFLPSRDIDLDERGIRIRLLRREGAFLELIEHSEARNLQQVAPNVSKRYLLHGVFKIGFEVGDLALAVEQLEALEVRLRGDIVTEPDGSMRSVQVEDPDGNVIQLFEVVRD